MTIEEIRNSGKTMLTPADVAEVLGCKPYTVNIQAREDRKNGTNSFPFPVITMGTRIKIPRKPFLTALGESED